MLYLSGYKQLIDAFALITILSSIFIFFFFFLLIVFLFWTMLFSPSRYSCYLALFPQTISGVQIAWQIRSAYRSDIHRFPNYKIIELEEDATDPKAINEEFFQDDFLCQPFPVLGSCLQNSCIDQAPHSWPVYSVHLRVQLVLLPYTSRQLYWSTNPPRSSYVSHLPYFHDQLYLSRPLPHAEGMQVLRGRGGSPTKRVWRVDAPYIDSRLQKLYENTNEEGCMKR